MLAGLTACQPAADIAPAAEPVMEYATSADRFIMGPLELEETTAKARAGDRDSAVRVAAHYRENAPTSQTSTDEIYWLEAAISLGDIGSMNMLAFALMRRNAPGDCAQALHWAQQWRFKGGSDETDLAANGKSYLEEDILRKCPAQ